MDNALGMELSVALEQLRWERRARELLQKIAIAAADSTSLDVALKLALDAVCESTGWPIGHALVKRDDGLLVTSGIWHLDDPERFRHFRQISEESSFAPGIGLPGRVCALAEPMWIMDVGTDDNFPRARAAGDLGVRAAFGFPVLARGQVSAVLEFFTPDMVEPDLPLLEVTRTAGMQLGRVTERIESELSLRQSELKFRSVTSSANDAIISADSSGAIVAWNRAAERMFGFAEGEVIGRRLTVIIPEHLRAKHDAGMARVKAGGEHHVIGRTVELEGRRSDGTEFPIELSLASWKVGGETFYSGIIRDITDRKSAEAKLRAAASQLEVSEKKAIEASRAKSDFVANMSHELRTPLNAILGFVQLMQRDASLSAEQRENLSIIAESGEHLLGLVNDVLSISKIEAGHSTLNEVAFDLRSLLNGVWGAFLPKTKSKGLDLELEVSPLLPRYVLGDESKLRQVLINLLGNAVKFTEHGRVALRARWEGGRATFEVEDTGPGIDPVDRDRIFDPFVQSSAGIQAHEGTGLGLVISRNFVALMGGELHVRSMLGAGACFWFEIDLAEATSDAGRVEAKRVARLAPGQPELRVLVADNDLANRKLLCRLLASVGFVVREAADGQQAVEAWRTWHPSFIWMDMRMPVMDGYQATIAIRAEEKTSQRVRTPIVALTASAFEQDRPSILAAGCDQIVAKPFKDETLFELLGHHLGARYEYQSTRHEFSTLARGAESRDALLAGVAALDPLLRERLRLALSEGDDLEALRVIKESEHVDRPLAEFLADRVRSFHLDELIELLEAAGSS